MEYVLFIAGYLAIGLAVTYLFGGYAQFGGATKE